ncbi:hypothetical protein L3V79_01165 [Thiotrichales bacterium 19S9-12]|nr:hypothetical protein [Thiotrichales bacterium 19S9-11]MCF6810969.1 hypothetical protein [Thiotrichales bacterium 19S9-12]
MDATKQYTDNSLISLHDILAIFIKRIKLFTSIFLIGIIVSAIAIKLRPNQYHYGYTVLPPLKISNAHYQNILTNEQLTNYLKFYLAEFSNIQTNKEDKLLLSQVEILTPPQLLSKKEKATVKANIDSSNYPFPLVQVATTEKNKSQAKALLKDYIRYASEQFNQNVLKRYRLELQLQKTQLSSNLANTQKVLAYADQYEIKTPKKQTSNQTEVPNYLTFSSATLAANQAFALAMKKISLYEKSLSDKSQLNELEKTPESITNFKINSHFLEDIKPVGTSKALLLAIAIFISFVFACIAIFLVEKYIQIKAN